MFQTPEKGYSIHPFRIPVKRSRPIYDCHGFRGWNYNLHHIKEPEQPPTPETPDVFWNDDLIRTIVRNSPILNQSVITNETKEQDKLDVNEVLHVSSDTLNYSADSDTEIDDDEVTSITESNSDIYYIKAIVDGREKIFKAMEDEDTECIFAKKRIALAPTVLHTSARMVSLKKDDWYAEQAKHILTQDYQNYSDSL